MDREAMLLYVGKRIPEFCFVRGGAEDEAFRQVFLQEALEDGGSEWDNWDSDYGIEGYALWDFERGILEVCACLERENSRAWEAKIDITASLNSPHPIVYLSGWNFVGHVDKFAVKNCRSFCAYCGGFRVYST